MYQQNPKELEGVANLLATKGRYGDSMMVHMNPIEVEGLASLSPTGSLTVNPDTGQPEAFLPFLLPLLGGIGGSALAGTAATGLLSAGGLSATALGAIGSGLGSFAATGDLKQGLVSGITGFGIGSALGGIGGAIGDSAKEAAIQTAQQSAIEGGKSAAQTLTDQALGYTAGEGLMSPNLVGEQLYSSVAQPTATQVVNDLVAQNPLRPTVGQNLGKAFSKEGFDALTSPVALIGAGVGEGTNMQIRADKLLEEQNKAFDRDNAESYEGAKRRLEANVYSEDIKPVDDYDNYASGGGITSVDPSDFQERFNGLVEMGAPIKRMQYGGMTFPSGAFLTGMNTGDNAPAKRQASLRDVQSITPEQLQQTYQNQGLPGFGPEIMYFTEEKGKDPNPYKGWVPDPIAPVIPVYEGTQTEITKAKMADWYAGKSPHPGRAPESESEKSFYNLLKSLEGQSGNDRTDLINQYNKGLGTATTTTPATAAAAAAAGAGTAKTASTGNLTADDYADLYGKYMNYDFNFAEGGGIQDLGGEGQANQEADRLIELTSMAILGSLPEEESEVVIQAFIDEFGDEAFQMLRDQVLETVVPGSQKEGEIVGSGGGMDDEIMGMIGNQQPVAVSPGEYIVPADVVSGLGDGSTDAGVQELDGMLDRVRVERTNTTQQPAPLRKGGVLPR